MRMFLLVGLSLVVTGCSSLQVDKRKDVVVVKSNTDIYNVKAVYDRAQDACGEDMGMREVTSGIRDGKPTYIFKCTQE